MCFLIGKAGGPSEVLLHDPPPRLLPIFLSKREGWGAGPEQTHGPTCLSGTWPAWHSGAAHSAPGGLLCWVWDSGRTVRAGSMLVTSRPPSPQLSPQQRDTASPRCARTPLVPGRCRWRRELLRGESSRGGPCVVEGPLRRAFVSQLRPTYCQDLTDPLGELPDQGIILEDILRRAPSEA